MKKLKIITVLIAIMCAAAFALAGCSKTEGEAGDIRTINVAFEGGICQAPIALAHELGFFAEEGLTTNLRLTGDLVTTRDLLGAGEIDVGAGMLAGWFVPIVGGVDARVTLGLHTGCASAYVLNNSETTGFAAGQRIFASGASGSAFHNIARRFIHRAGLTDSQVTWLAGAADAALAGLRAGEADVIVIPDSAGQPFVDSGEFRRVRSLEDDDFKDESCCVVVMMGNFINNNPKTAEKITRAVYKAARWMNESEENTTAAIQALIDAQRLSSSALGMVGLIRNWQWGLAHSKTETTLDTSIVEYKALGLMGANIDNTEFKNHVWQPQKIDDITVFDLPKK
ncbi:MAG: ABC transporter substrate-binding protein [Firmicutes bacterium]|nr:ABC transporter substrate-binding protein [Bacillota bacterium]